MKKISPKSLASSRRNFTKTALSALAMSPFASLASQTAASSQEERQSSPITIGGGGSVGIDFDDQYYREGAPGQFVASRDTIHRLWLIDKHGGLQNITPGSENCQVTIQCKRRGKTTNVIVQGTPLGISFERDEFADRRARKRRPAFLNVNHKIQKLEITVGGVTKPIELPSDKKCTIVVVNTL